MLTDLVKCQQLALVMQQGGLVAGDGCSALPRSQVLQSHWVGAWGCVCQGGHRSEVAQGKHWWEVYGLENPMVAEAQGIHQRHHIQHAYLALVDPRAEQSPPQG